jgi:GR25 family glycosyltransferase involved in LPS biosynthesis
MIFTALIVLMKMRQKARESFLNDSVTLQKYINKFNTAILQSEKITIPYPVYYINMDKDIERKKHLENQKLYVNADFRRIRGFNGREITNKNHDIVDGIEFENEYEELTKSEIGCTISHLLAIDTAWKNGDKIAIICEDDISFSTISIIPDLEDIVDDSPSDWEILQLCSFLDDYNGKMSSSLQYIKRVYPEHAFWGCGFYIINRKGMDRILKAAKKDRDKNFYSIKPVRKLFPRGGVADGYILDLATTYASFPSLFIVDNTELDSTIHTDHTSRHIRNSLLTVERLVELY